MTGTAVGWRLHLFKSQEGLQLLLIVGADTSVNSGSAAVYHVPIVTDQPYDVDILYDTAHRFYSWSVNGDLQIAANMPDDYPLIGTKVIGSSGSSTGRDTAYVVDNVSWVELSAGTPYTFFATTGQPLNLATTTDPANPLPVAGGSYNLEVLTNATGNGPPAPAPGYDGLAIMSSDTHTLFLAAGNHGLVDNDGYNRIGAGPGNVSIGGAPGDTIIGGTGDTFIDAARGNQSVVGGSAGNETIWAGAGDTIRGGSGGNETIGGVSGNTIIGGAANTFIDAHLGSQPIAAGSGNTTIWGGSGDMVHGATGTGSATIAFGAVHAAETYWDDGATSTGNDSVFDFNQALGDRVSLNSGTDNADTVVASAMADGGGNAVLHLSDGSNVTFVGLPLAALDASFFTTH
jgi:hypothetical protein